MGNFILLWLIMMVFFTHAFNSFFLTNGNQGCLEDFDGLQKTFYTVFRMMLNMVDTTQYDVSRRFLLALMHIVFVFQVAIILINFLIATMSESATRTAEHHQVIERLNALSICVTIQQRFGFWLLKPYYNFMLPRVFSTDKNGRICVVMRVSCDDIETMPSTREATISAINQGKDDPVKALNS